MADDPTEKPHRPPVHMGLRVLARHSAGRHGGRALAHSVVEARAPKLLPSAVRLSRAPAPPARPPAPAPAAAAPPAPAPPAAAFDRPSFVPTGMSDFAAQWMFGDQGAASQDLVSMDIAARMAE